MLNKIESTCRTKFKVCDSRRTEDGAIMPVIYGQCGEVDKVSGNGYRYKRGFWDAVFANGAVEQSIRNRDMLGMIEHPLDDNDFVKTPYDKASHVVLNAWVGDDGNPYAEFGLLNNRAGNDIKALVEVGHRPGVSTRGFGTFGNDDISQFVEHDGYVLITWDIVRSPNFGDLKMDRVSDSLMASPIFKELSEMNGLRDCGRDYGHNKERLKADMAKAIEALQKLITNL